MSDLIATPRPWLWSDSQDGLITSKGKDICEITPTNGDVDDDLSTGYTGEQIANGNLIIAAHELYIALEQAVTSMQDHGWPNSHLAVKEARRALAKARGET
ncbi:MAG: hypothetical protein CME80_08280 [Halomonas sp.]|nr:hypothetical protein [Halomonas sp.]MBF57700.1 hypothetical protein [Halomonas sp.]|tara:strand:- start:10165 stop:10467 length:303 start_codon:yes stop_codon:yes gene_type:complete